MACAVLVVVGLVVVLTTHSQLAFWPTRPAASLIRPTRRSSKTTEKSFSMRSPAMTVGRSMSVSMREMISDNAAQGKHPEILLLRGFSPAVRAVTTR